MIEPIIKVENLGKKYQIGAKESYYSLRDKISGIFDLKNWKNKERNEFWALKDVNFEVKKGESVGIIGRNGAGKSTLLKILSQITPPTTGKITMKGRVASLLEVGTGFNPELTGRENIFLNGAILGMTREEIKRKFDEIVAFAEIEKFLDTPVKRYSSGMYMRLAFAVAAHLESEILIVDEVLAVGDAQFQKKCLGKMNDVTKNEGRTVLFVSHNMGAIRELCPRCILLSDGSLKEYGETSSVVKSYNNTFSQNTNVLSYEGDRDKIEILSVCLVDDENLEAKNVDNSFPIRVKVKIKPKNGISSFRVGLSVLNEDGIRILTLHSKDIVKNFPTQKNVLFFEIPPIFKNGRYFIDIGAHSLSGEWWFCIQKIIFFDVSITEQKDYNQGLIYINH